MLISEIPVLVTWFEKGIWCNLFPV